MYICLYVYHVYHNIHLHNPLRRAFNRIAGTHSMNDICTPQIKISYTKTVKFEKRLTHTEHPSQIDIDTDRTSLTY